MGQTSSTAREPHPEVADEQGFLDYAYACLADMRERARFIKSLGYLGGNVHADVGVTPEARAKWDADKQRRVDLLADPVSALCFGRIDRVDDERFYIGSRHVEDAEGGPVVTDWRAPVAAPFYRATVVDPLGLDRRRRFLLEDRQLVDVFDENLRDPDGSAAAAYVPDPLLAEIQRARTGEMRDIVATIQAEQDVIIRAPLEECIIVQGGPGTGKTAVGLHRAAFLLYTHRELFERRRLLIIGPNKIFLRYIAQVLPSLGETASVQLTIEGLTGPRYRVRATDPTEVARVKGDARMIEVVRRVVFDNFTAVTRDLPIGTSFGTVTLAVTDVSAVFEAALRRVRPTNDQRTILRRQLVELAWRTHSRKQTSDIFQKERFLADVRDSRELKTTLDKAWPALSAAAVIRRLYSNRAVLTRCTADLLSDAERDVIARKPAPKLSEERWTRADLALLDEADALISGGVSTYGHIVVDEAQDLSALELRMVARRSRQGSMTVLGDLAQATGPAAQTEWKHARRVLGASRVRLEELAVGYRVPAPIIDLANRLLPEAAPGLRPTSSVRLRGDPPAVIPVTNEDRSAATAAETVHLAERWNTVAVVSPRSLMSEIGHALGAAGVDFIDSERSAALGEHVTLLSPVATKGLEFDAVVVVEPGAIMREEPHGARALYVVLTRAVQHLTIIHADPLPSALAREDAAAAGTPFDCERD